MYRVALSLIRKLRDSRTGLIPCITGFFPFFLILSSTLLSHVFSLFLSLIFMISWFDTFHEEHKVPLWLTLSVSGLSLGLLMLSRPLTALGFIIPFIIHGIILVIRGSHQQRKTVFIFAGIVLCLSRFIFSGNMF